MDDIETQDQRWDVLRIVVPGAVDGVPREVSWSGEGEPPAWFAGLAEIALTGQLQHRNARGPLDRNSTERVLEILEILRSTGVQSTSATVVEDVRDLINMQAKQGAAVLVARLNHLHGELDAHKRALAGAIERRDALESQLVTAREGLEYARSQFFSLEEEIVGANWTDVVSRTIVERLDNFLGASASQA